jgi:hypothetical protein
MDRLAVGRAVRLKRVDHELQVQHVGQSGFRPTNTGAHLPSERRSRSTRSR